MSSSLTYLRPEVAALKKKVDQFVEQEVIPCEAEYASHMKDRHGADRWTMDAVPPCLSKLQRRAQELGIWNIFLPPRLISHLPNSDLSLAPPLALTYREYGIICESLGRSIELAPQACNSSAPDTGNMEVLLEFGTKSQQREYLLPLLQGKIRSTFLMTEPAVASSDPTNLETKLTKVVDKSGKVSYLLSGRKWWSTGAMDPRCRVGLCVAKMDYSHPSCPKQDDESSQHGAHTIVIVPLPHPNVQMVRPLTVFGYDDAPFGHAEVLLDNVPLSEEHLILGEGSGFRVSQARLGPGRIHHCMRAIGMGTCCVLKRRIGVLKARKCHTHFLRPSFSSTRSFLFYGSRTML
jgi:acyl-CoA dehydrogenase